MKKLKISLIFALVASMLLFVACDKSDKQLNVSAIKIDDTSVYFVYEIDDFDISDIKLLVTDNKGKTQSLALSNEFISNESAVLLTTEGEHLILIEYGGQTTQFNLNLVAQKNMFHTTYELALSAGAADTDYQTWLNTIKGEKGEKIQLNATQTYLQYRYEGEMEWTNLLDLSALKGADGKNGANGKEVELGIDNGNVCWRYKGDSTWRQLYSLSQMKGAAGSDGKNGTNGKDGKDGLTPYIHENGNWWIGDEDTGLLVFPQDRTDSGTSGLYFAMTIVDGVAGYEITSYNNEDEEELVIPGYLYGIKVVSIAKSVFKDNNYIERVVIPSTIIKIDESAFSGCRNLTTVTIQKNSNLVRIEKSAFANCYSLTKIDLPNTIKYIGDYAFGGIELYNIVLPKSLQYVGAYAFTISSYDGFSIFVESQDTTGWHANWTNRDSLQIHLGVKAEGDYLYNYNEDGTVRLVGYLGEERKLIIPSKLDNKAITSIGSYAFVGNNLLEGIIIPKSVNMLESLIIGDNDNLSYIYIPDSVITMESFIGYYFYINYNFRIYLEVESIPESWGDWINLKEEYYPIYLSFGVGENDLIIEGGCHYVVKNNTVTLTGTLYLEYEDLVIPSKIQGKTVDSIAPYAFVAVEFNKIVLPDTITKIQSYTFCGVRIKEVFEIGSGINIIEKNAFVEVTAYIFIPTQPQPILIGENAFSGCAIFTPYIERPLGWDSNFAKNSYVYWNTKKLFIENGFYAILKTDNKAAIIAYDTSYNLGTIFIPETIQGYTVNEIKENAIRVTGNTKIVVKDNIEIIEKHGIYLSGNYNRIFVETYTTYTKPEGWHSNWYYNYGSYNYLHWDNQWQYIEGVPTPK